MAMEAPVFLKLEKIRAKQGNIVADQRLYLNINKVYRSYFASRKAIII